MISSMRPTTSAALMKVQGNDTRLLLLALSDTRVFHSFLTYDTKYGVMCPETARM